MSDFNTVNGQETAGDISYLFKCFALAPHLEQVLVVDEEVPLFRVARLVFHDKLTVEERFAFVAFVNT